MDAVSEHKNPPLSNSGVLSRPDGSAIFNQGNTTVLAGVYGPFESKVQKLLIDKANVEAHFRPKAGLPGIGDRLYEAVIRNICETALVTTLYPRTTVQVIIQEMQNGGEIVACAVNAACLALLDSGIDMKFLVGAVMCCLDFNGQFTYDPTTLEQQKAKASFVFVFDSAEGNIVASYTNGSFGLKDFERAVDMCRKKSADVFDYYKSIISRKCL